MPEPIRTLKVCVLSTAHLRLSTLRLLETTPYDKWPVLGGMIPYGPVIFAHDEFQGDEPADLVHVLTFARCRGFDYVRFDCEEPPIRELQQHDHAAQADAAKAEEAETCSDCGARLDEAGDGYDGRCATCADKADASEEEEEPHALNCPALTGFPCRCSRNEEEA